MAFFLKQDCPFCKDYGQIGFMLCDDLQKIVFMCDECDGRGGSVRRGHLFVGGLLRLSYSKLRN